MEAESHSCFESLLAMNNSVSPRQIICSCYSVEIFKTKQHLSQSFMKDIVIERSENYNLRSGSALQLQNARQTAYGIESVSFLGQQLWHALPENLKQSENLAIFEKTIENLKDLDCPCRVCKACIAD